MAPYEVGIAADGDDGVVQFSGRDLEDPAPVREAIAAHDIDDLHHMTVVAMKGRAALSIVHHSLQVNH
jgi:hypothetical protein